MRKQLPFLISLLLPLLVSCMENGGDGDSDGDIVGVDSAPAVVCDCPAVTAGDVSFDNTETALTSTTVQTALVEVGELASIEAPNFADKISAEENEATTVSGTTLTAQASCGGSQGDFLALGGGCSTSSSNLELVETELTAELMTCRWRKLDGVSATGKARVTCLSLLP